MKKITERDISVYFRLIKLKCTGVNIANTFIEGSC